MALDYKILAGMKTLERPSVRTGIEQGLQDMYKARLQGVMNQELEGDPTMQAYSAMDPVAALKMKQQQDMRREDPTKKSIRELEQLWKDAERSLRYARQQGDTVGVNYYTRLQKNLVAQLKQLRPEIWGDGEKDETTTTTQEDGVVLVDTSAIKTQLAESAKDENTDGKIDDYANWIDQVTKWKRANKLADDRAEVKDVTTYVENLITEVAGKRQMARQKVEEGQRDYEVYVKQNLPNIGSIYTGLNGFRTKLVNAISQAKRSKAGGAYVAMKGVLGDALSASDLAGMTGAGFSQGVIGKIKDFFGASTLTDAESEKFLNAAIEGFNEGLVDYNKKFDQSTSFGRKAAKSYKVNPISDKFKAENEKIRPKSVFDTKKAAKPNRKDFEKMADYLRALKAWKKENP